MGKIDKIMMEFKIDENQENKLKEWKEKIKDLFGEYGHFTYKFIPNGIFTAVKVYSDKTNTEIDLTDYDNI